MFILSRLLDCFFSYDPQIQCKPFKPKLLTIKYDRDDEFKQLSLCPPEDLSSSEFESESDEEDTFKYGRCEISKPKLRAVDNSSSTNYDDVYTKYSSINAVTTTTTISKLTTTSSITSNTINTIDNNEIVYFDSELLKKDYNNENLLNKNYFNNLLFDKINETFSYPNLQDYSVQEYNQTSLQHGSFNVMKDEERNFEKNQKITQIANPIYPVFYEKSSFTDEFLEEAIKSAIKYLKLGDFDKTEETCLWLLKLLDKSSLDTRCNILRSIRVLQILSCLYSLSFEYEQVLSFYMMLIDKKIYYGSNNRILLNDLNYNNKE